ncbi:hypothetical protein D1BOALGB6SA_8276 [Olavius sp. associated proteobacterium Delta 1]|nr:hypothetical protein D1BOALGB6SA_8276 [Olavius sp. associated proteobacterium Delta 1]
MSVAKRQQDARELFTSDKPHQASSMANRIVFLVTLFLLLAPSICRADVATALIEIGFLFLVLIVPIEAYVFCNYPKLRNKLSSSDKLYEKMGGMEILTIVLVANLASSAAGSFFQFYKYRLENLITLGIAFVLSIIIEWLVYIIYFLIQRRKKVLELLNICIIGNLTTYLIFFLPPASVNLLSSFDYDRLARGAARNVVDAKIGYYDIPTNTDISFDLATLRSYGYREPEREAFGIKIKMEVEIKVLEDRSNPRIATWHKKGRRVFLVDKNLDITEILKTELDDDLKLELDF